MPTAFGALGGLVSVVAILAAAVATTAVIAYVPATIVTLTIAVGIPAHAWGSLLSAIILVDGLYGLWSTEKKPLLRHLPPPLYALVFATLSGTAFVTAKHSGPLGWWLMAGLCCIFFFIATLSIAVQMLEGIKSNTPPTTDAAPR